MRWFEEQRQNWIAEMLWIYGFISREHLMKKFGISTAQAAVDFRTFQDEHPGAMKYNLSTKRYEAVTCALP
jgi:DeoR/GlpR family transcriptional regulator of sugar metabolism